MRFCLVLCTCTMYSPLCLALSTLFESIFFNNSKLWFNVFTVMFSLHISFSVCLQREKKMFLTLDDTCGTYYVLVNHINEMWNLFLFSVSHTHNVCVLNTASLFERRRPSLWINTLWRFKVFLNFNSLIIYLRLARQLLEVL